MNKHFFQSYSIQGYFAKITIEWSAPEGIDMDELDRHRAMRAEDIADEVMGHAGPKVREIVQAMRGRT